MNYVHTTKYTSFYHYLKCWLICTTVALFENFLVQYLLFCEYFKYLLFCEYFWNAHVGSNILMVFRILILTNGHENSLAMSKSYTD